MTFGRFNPLFSPRIWDPEAALTVADWSPPVDIIEGENALIIKAELPGIEAKDISVTVDKNVVTIKGERKAEHEVKKENYHRMERSYGKFTRSFALPGSADGANIRADNKDGLLTLTIPKKAAATARKVEIQK